MARPKIIALVLLGLCGSMVLAVEVVNIGGARYATTITSSVSGKPVQLRLTGAAMRRKLIVNVYAIGSYVQEGVTIRSPEELAAANCVKRLHLVMERDVSGKDMAEAFRAAIRRNHAAPAFNDEVNALVECMQSKDARKADEVWLTHVPGVGLEVNLVGKAEMLIRNPAFSRAVWDIYLGKNNLGEAIKKGLVSRL